MYKENCSTSGVVDKMKALLSKEGGRNMKDNHSKIETMIKKIVNKVVEGEERGWPPGCATLLYQPERPERQSEDMD